MKKAKKIKKTKAGKNTLLGGAAKSLKKLGKGIGSMSTTKKVVGGATLVALGLGYLSKRHDHSVTSAAASKAEDSLAELDGNV
ncbi:hypothetical protein [Hymenobacter lapidiphilus]|uniref:Uncharacterized protein n=1 Tax=Hymenobacter lapidiphilus TaxID=2608003 RepID=A0A7Y7PRS6_9BACT|nr:hypothetical protein [Hymenobacter lapidiphilus]NVO32858.1 hypothetical protein [Hymenobacter lapidiphilus]